MIKRTVIYFLFFFLLSCTGSLEKKWIVEDFSKSRTFTLDVPKSKSVNNVNVYLSGDFEGTIYLSTVKEDSTMQYTSQTLPNDRLFIDFYGGQFNLYLAPSDAVGKLEVKLEVPYGP